MCTLAGSPSASLPSSPDSALSRGKAEAWGGRGECYPAEVPGMKRPVWGEDSRGSTLPQRPALPVDSAPHRCLGFGDVVDLQVQVFHLHLHCFPCLHSCCTGEFRLFQLDKSPPTQGRGISHALGTRAVQGTGSQGRRGSRHSPCPPPPPPPSPCSSSFFLNVSQEPQLRCAAYTVLSSSSHEASSTPL